MNLVVRVIGIHSMRVCLVRCSSPFLIDEKVFPPLGLMAVGTVLKSEGHDVTVYDGDMINVPLDYDHYGFGPTTPEYPYAVEAKDHIKKHNQDAVVVLGGPHATVAPQDCKKDGFDHIVSGSLNEYPLVDRTLVDIKSYKYFIKDKLATTMMTSFGCPYQCAFCCKTEKSVSMRSSEEVIKEIEYLHNDFGYEAIMFFDDIFILDKRRTKRICECLKELGIAWRCFVRGDLILKHGPEFVLMMAKSGCVEVGIGIESGSNKVLSIINKGETIETIRLSVKMLMRQGIKVKGFFILGLPGESPSTLDETRKFMSEMQLDDMDVKVYQPYPGNTIWDNRPKYDIQWDEMEPKDMFYKGRPGDYHGNVRTSTLTNAQIVSAMNELEGTYKQWT